MGTITSLGLWLCVFNLFCVISQHYVWIPLLQRDLIGLATPTVWRSWTMLRFENAAGGCWWTVTHSADTLCSCSRTHTSTGIFTLPGIPLDTCAVFQKPFRNVHIASCSRIINYHFPQLSCSNYLPSPGAVSLSLLETTKNCSIFIV